MCLSFGLPSDIKYMTLNTQNNIYIYILFVGCHTVKVILKININCIIVTSYKFGIHHVECDVFNVWRWSRRPTHSASIYEANKICCVWRQSVSHYLIWYTTQDWIIQKKKKLKSIPFEVWTAPEGPRRLKLPVSTWRWHSNVTVRSAVSLMSVLH